MGGNGAAQREAAVLEAARFLAAHAGEALSLGDVADHVAYSPFHLARAFERRIGIPPGQYLAAVRFQRAKELLLAGDLRTLDVCDAVGFRSLGTFTRRFAEAVGTTPTGFRRLPDQMADAAPRPFATPGPARPGGTVRGRVNLTAEASATVGTEALVYVGLFAQRAPSGRPVSGALVDQADEFLLTGVPAGTYWLLASAVPARTDPATRLLPPHPVGGGSPAPVTVSAASRHHLRVVAVDAADLWSPPIVLSLPALGTGPDE